ncbi:MAG: hypothetical protein Kapaf2KO_03270 [Candidatus Kapaibacteriales bacterium]
MTKINPQYITDNSGQKLIVLKENEYLLLLEELDMLEDIRLYDEAKKEDDGTRISYQELKRSVTESI